MWKNEVFFILVSPPNILQIGILLSCVFFFNVGTRFKNILHCVDTYLRKKCVHLFFITLKIFMVYNKSSLIEKTNYVLEIQFKFFV